MINFSNKKSKRIFSIVIILILVLAMILSMAAAYA